FFFSSRRRHTRWPRDWSSDVCSSDLGRCDQYALACVLYEMLAGQPPFTGPTLESVLIRHLTAEVPRITDLQPDVPKPVAAALTRSEERRVGKECRGRVSADREKKQMA